MIFPLRPGRLVWLLVVAGIWLLGSCPNVSPFPVPASSGTIATSEHVAKDCQGAKCATNVQERAALPLYGDLASGRVNGTEGALDDRLEVAVERSRREADGETDYEDDEEGAADAYYYEGGGADEVGGKKRMIGLTIFVVWVCWIAIVCSVLRIVAKNLA